MPWPMHRPHVQPLRRSPPGFLRGASVAVLAQGFHKRPKLARHACQPKVVPASFKDDSSAFLQSWSFSRAEQAWVLALATLCLPWSWTTVRAQRRGGLVHGAAAVAGPLGANARRTWAHLRPAWDTAVANVQSGQADKAVFPLGKGLLDTVRRSDGASRLRSAASSTGAPVHLGRRQSGPSR